MANNNLIRFTLFIVSYVLAANVSGSGFTEFMENLKKNVENAVQNVNKTTESSEQNQSTYQPAATELSREENREIQQLLTAAGHDPGPVDGFPGARTKDAIRKYQAENGIAVDGEPSRGLLSHLRQNAGGIGRTVVAAPASAKASATSKSSSSTTQPYSPFGIPLLGKFSSDFFTSSPKATAVSNGMQFYEVSPRQTHPDFDSYQVAVLPDNTIAQIVATSRVYGEALNVCYQKGKQIAHAVGSKYGAEIRDQSSNHFEIYKTHMRGNGSRNVGLSLRWHCIDSGSKKRRSATFKLWDGKLVHAASERAKQEARTPSEEISKGVKNVF